MHNTQKSSQAPGKRNPRVVIACRVMKPELDALAGDGPDIEIRYLDQNMHEKPAQALLKRHCRGQGPPAGVDYSPCA
ncbi:MAG: hypothetical protein JRD49_15865 [Deltaproteobacteria bacterium]|nr:hypothetical protein [Deltaproteobacteria bacterium]